MARIKKLDTEIYAESDPRLCGNIHRFIIYADDLIKEQRSVKHELIAVLEPLSSISKTYERTHHAIAKRESEGTTVHIGTDIENARKRTPRTLEEPLAKAKATARENRFIALFFRFVRCSCWRSGDCSSVDFLLI